jgi:SOS-response transcriptional repressor LexA
MENMDYYVMSPKEAIVWLDTMGVRYEVCDTPIPIMGNKLNCGVTLGIGDETIEGYYYLPKSAVGLHPQMEVPAQGDSMIDAGIEEGDLLRLEIGALPADGDIVMAEIDGEVTVKVFFTDAEKRHWLCPMNRRYQPILLKESMNVRISAVVRTVVKSLVRQSYSDCMAIVNRACEQRQKEADVLQRLCAAVTDGCHLFWASSAWAVAFGVARDVCGFGENMKDFERKALALSLPQSFKYLCTQGTVQRTISNHPYMCLHIDKWRENGASMREIVLMQCLRNFLQ